MQVNSPGDGDQYESMAEINIIPLVDVMLVLLIVFMIAAPLSITGITVNLPQSKAKGSEIEEKKIVLTINKEGSYYLDRTQIPADQLETKFKSIYEFREDKAIYIRADGEVAYERVIDAMTAAKMAGVHKMSMLTRQPTKG